MSVHPWWSNYIRQGALKRGLDPVAVLRVANVEGLSGAVGDGGHAFGPFQMNDAGGVLTNRPGNHKQFAESRAGIDEALDAMVPHARGLKGEAAVRAIVTKYERPADPEGEIARAMGVSPPPRSENSALPSYDTAMTQLGTGAGRAALQGGVQDALQGAATIRDQARQNLADIASGGTSASDAFAKIPAMIQAMHSSLPKVSLPLVQPSGIAQTTATDHQAVALARKYIGTKYTWGGENPETGFDCSGLLQYVWKAMGVKIPRVTYDQWDAGTPVDASQLKQGDAVFFTGSDPRNGKPGHVGMYIGEGKFIEAPGRGKDVRISTLAGRTDFVGARRFG